MTAKPAKVGRRLSARVGDLFKAKAKTEVTPARVDEPPPKIDEPKIDEPKINEPKPVAPLANPAKEAPAAG